LWFCSLKRTLRKAAEFADFEPVKRYSLFLINLG
jgi:hypothetical protein